MAEKAKLNTKIFLRLIAYAKVYKGIFALAFGAGLLIAASSAFRPKFIGDMVEKYVVQGQNGQMLLMWTLIIIGMLIMESVLQFAGSYFSNLLAQNIVRDLRKKLYKHVISFKMQYFDRTWFDTKCQVRSFSGTFNPSATVSGASSAIICPALKLR